MIAFSLLLVSLVGGFASLLLVSLVGGFVSPVLVGGFVSLVLVGFVSLESESDLVAVGVH